MSEQSNGGGPSPRSSQQAGSGLYGDGWTPSPDDPNYAAYLKYQQNLQQATGGSKVASFAPAGAPKPEETSVEGSSAGFGDGSPASADSPTGSDSGEPRVDAKGRPVNPSRPQQENPDAAPSDYFLGPLAKPGHWSDKPNPDAPWWANPYTYVGKGEWRKPNWGPSDGSGDVSVSEASPQNESQAGQTDRAGSADSVGQAGQADSAGRVDQGSSVEEAGTRPQSQNQEAAQGGAVSGSPSNGEGDANSGGCASSTTSSGGNQPKGAWVPTGRVESPWVWDASALPNQTIDGKPCRVPLGAWVPSGNPSAPWAWDATVLPNEYREGKPVYVPSVGEAYSSQSASSSAPTPNAQSVWAGIPDLSKESGEDRPDVPRATRIGWFFIGLIGGFLGLVFAWMVGSKYPQKQRRQVVRWCWAGFFCWCMLMFAIMGFNASGGFGSLGMDGGSSAMTSAGSSASSGGAFD